MVFCLTPRDLDMTGPQFYGDGMYSIVLNFSLVVIKGDLSPLSIRDILKVRL